MAWVNSVDPDQTPIKVYTVCHSFYILRMHYCMLKPPRSNFRIVMTIMSGVSISTTFTAMKFTLLCIPFRILTGSVFLCCRACLLMVGQSMVMLKSVLVLKSELLFYKQALCVKNAENEQENGLF